MLNVYVCVFAWESADWVLADSIACFNLKVILEGNKKTKLINAIDFKKGMFKLFIIINVNEN